MRSIYRALEKTSAVLTPIFNFFVDRPFSGEYTDHTEKGDYLCVVCEKDLFSSESKFDSHCGWPAFSKPVSGDAVDCTDDYTHSKSTIHQIMKGSHLHFFSI
mgnify:CR=1 FL=1